jgi:hypothetical protein
MKTTSDFSAVLTSHYFSVSTGSSTNRPMEYPWDDPYALSLQRRSTGKGYP